MSACAFLIKNHDVFLLEPGELECMSPMKHEIQVINDEHFKEGFWRIPPPMVEEVRANIRKCWKSALYALAKSHGVMLSC